MSQSTIIHGDALTELHKLLAESVQCCVTSPPYHGLRDYGVPPTDWPEMSYSPMAGLPPMTIPAMSCCLGMEPDLWSFIGHIVLLFRGVHRALKDDGTLWLNMGDSYMGSWGSQGREYSNVSVSALSARQVAASARKKANTGTPTSGLKPKDLTGQPWRVAFALQADGWYLRSEIIWHKLNPMPESVGDRPTKSHEQLFLFSKSPKYYYDADAIKEPASESTHARMAQNVAAQNGSMRANGGSDRPMKAGGRSPKIPGKNSRIHVTRNGGADPESRIEGSMSEAALGQSDFRNKRDVWPIATQAYKEAHFATFPPALVRPCIMAGTRPGDSVLDPFAGSGTTGQVALELGRNAVLIEIGRHHIPLIQSRTDITPGLPI